MSVSNAIAAVVAVIWISSPQLSQAQNTGYTEAQKQIEQLQQRIIEIQREYQLELDDLRRQSDVQMEELQAQIDRINNGLPLSESTSAAVLKKTDNPSGGQRRFTDNLDIAGDFRVRYENNSSDGAVPAWDRGVLRGRLEATYTPSDNLALGGRLVTGDPDSPRTSDTTMGDFVSDLDIALDQAYAALTYQDLFLSGGKIVKPFASTELLWDGDVNPFGLGGHYELINNKTWSVRLSGIYSIVDENTIEKRSDMLGGQFTVSLRPHNDWHLSLHSAYYDYDIGVLDPDIPGGARGNNVSSGENAYVSDFDLLDTIGTAVYSGFAERWPVKIVADYVRNLGAKVPEDTGYGLDLVVGSLSKPNYFLLRYGYSHVETDAVLGMFTNDNITLATNYKLHTFSVDCSVLENMFVGLTHYVYRRLEHDPAIALFPNEWVSRTRLNLNFAF